MVSKILAAFAAVFLYIGFVNVSAEEVALNSQQLQYLSMARQAGGAIGWPETMESIAWQESSIGRFKVGDDGKSLGLAHVQVDTAIEIMQKYQWAPQLPYKTYYDRTKIAKRLISDDKYDLLIASLYFNDCYHQFQNWRRALICYNGGPTVAAEYKTDKQINSFPYVIAIKHRLAQLHSAENQYYVLNVAIDPEIETEVQYKNMIAAYFKKLPIIPTGPNMLDSKHYLPCFILADNNSLIKDNKKKPPRNSCLENKAIYYNQQRNHSNEKATILSKSSPPKN